MAINTAVQSLGELPELLACEDGVIKDVVAAFDDFAAATPHSLLHPGDLQGDKSNLALYVRAAHERIISSW